MTFDIPGLLLCPGYISPDEETQLISSIDRQPWLTDLKRRVQQYGFRYDYRRKGAHTNRPIVPIPSWLNSLGTRMYRDGYIPAQPDQAAINEYLPGQGISAHVDCVPCFGDTVLALSLGSFCVMRFTPLTGTDAIDVLLAPRSLLIMRGEARYAWKHAIPARKSDVYAGWTFRRERRLSVTFRTVVQPEMAEHGNPDDSLTLASASAMPARSGARG
jgi:alkylated DNA repair dioxygenase AlkB